MAGKLRHSIALIGVAVWLVSMWIVPAGAVRDANGRWAVLDVGGTKPSARKHHTMVYDPVYNRVILFAGENTGGIRNDAWALDLAASSPQWIQLPNGPTLHGHAAAYGDGKMFVVCGQSGTTPSFDVYGYALNLGANPSWGASFNLFYGMANPCDANQPVAAPRTHSVAGYLNGRLFIQGGRGYNALAQPTTTILQDTWSYGDHDQNGAWTWWWNSGRTDDGTFEGMTPVACKSGDAPFRYWGTMVSTGDKLIVYGGNYLDLPVASAQVLTDSLWVPIGQASEIHMFHASAWDQAASRMVVVGGYENVNSEGTPLDIRSDVMALNWTNNQWQWSQLSPGGATLGAIAEHAAVYDPVRDRVIVFGGVTGGGTLRANDTWVLDFLSPATATLTLGRGTTTATVSWTAPGDDGAIGTAAEYDLRYQYNTPITEANFQSATRITVPAPQTAGMGECADVTDLQSCNKRYYFALKTRDAAGNWSALSNVPSITTKCNGAEVMCGGALMFTTPEMPTMVEFQIRGANPAAGLTTLFVGVPSGRQGESMELSIFDVKGARVRTLSHGAAAEGEREFAWDHRGENGSPVPAGIYFARLMLGNEARTLKVVVTAGR